MPIYEFECRKCKAHSEVLQKLNAKQPVKCSKCGGRLERIASAPAIQFKGTGWYVTDYGSNGKKGKSSEEKSDTSNTTSSTKSDTKETSPAKKSSESTSAPEKSSGD